MRKVWDRLFLISTALLAVVLGCGAFAIGEVYHANPAWTFAVRNSIWLVPVILPNFRDRWKSSSFVLFLFGWMCAHGLITIGLMRWVRVRLWPVLVALELFAGYLIAYCLESYRKTTKQTEVKRIDYRRVAWRELLGRFWLSLFPA